MCIHKLIKFIKNPEEIINILAENSQITSKMKSKFHPIKIYNNIGLRTYDSKYFEMNSSKG